jgi:tRNA pseudouridine38-40 synthase
MTLPACVLLQNRQTANVSKKIVPSAQNWLLLLTFDGTCYHGWQVQPDSPTIQDTLEKAIQRLTGETVRVHGAGRTDSGVHALNYTANFALTSKNIKAAQTASEDFHARHSAIGKLYRYLICNNSYHSPFAKYQSWLVSQTLDIKLMRQAAEVLTGEHDFSAFRAASCSSPNTVKNIRGISISKSLYDNSTLLIEIEANSFLQHMVRIITGTLVEVGQGRKNCDDVEKALKSGDRNLAGSTAPAHGLYALEVIYPQGMICWPQEVIDN